MKIQKTKITVTSEQKNALAKLLKDAYAADPTCTNMLQKLVLATHDKTTYGLRLFVKHYRVYTNPMNPGQHALIQKRRHDVDVLADNLEAHGGVSVLNIEFADSTIVSLQSICQVEDVFCKREARRHLLSRLKSLSKNEVLDTTICAYNLMDRTVFNQYMKEQNEALEANMKRMNEAQAQLQEPGPKVADTAGIEVTAAAGLI